MTLPSKKELDSMDMSEVAKMFNPCPEISYLFDAAGFNHYRLLRWIGENNYGKLIFDIGTFMGLSAGSFAYSDNNIIHTFDTSFAAMKLQPLETVIKNKVVNETDIPDNLTDANIILVDTWHNGIMERKIFDTLVAANWKGILIYDDIYYNASMKAFWESIDHPGKIDVTAIGHSTGTGIIEFI